MDKDELKNFLGKAFTFKGGSPIVFVTEVFYERIGKDIVNETSGFAKFQKGSESLKFKLVWFFENKREAGFKEVHLFENELSEYEGKLNYHLESGNTVASKLNFGDLIHLPRKVNYDENQKKTLARIFPNMTLIDVERNKEQSKFGTPSIIRPEFLVKCKWYNGVSGKFQEQMLPMELFIQPIQNITIPKIPSLIPSSK